MNLHGKIMNLPCLADARDRGPFANGYKDGHRATRHAAAELANEADALCAELLAALVAIEPFIPSTSASEGGAAKFSANVAAADLVRAAIARATNSQEEA